MRQKPVNFLSTSDLEKLISKLDNDHYLADAEDVVNVLKILQEPETNTEAYDYFMELLSA